MLCKNYKFLLLLIEQIKMFSRRGLEIILLQYGWNLNSYLNENPNALLIELYIRPQDYIQLFCTVRFNFQVCRRNGSILQFVFELTLLFRDTLLNNATNIHDFYKLCQLSQNAPSVVFTQKPCMTVICFDTHFFLISLLWFHHLNH